MKEEHFGLFIEPKRKLCYILGGSFLQAYTFSSSQPKERRGRAILPTPFPSGETLDKFSAFKGIGRLKLLVMAVFLTNSLQIATPLEALAAEICEPESSMFSMPILLLVALIGATVGESQRVKTGKTFLRNQEPEKAYAEFKIALELAKSLKDPIKEKKAARGLGASLQRQGKYREAIQYHSMVLAISKREGEDSGITEAYGAIADCYTELGDLEKAGNFYDTYIARLETD
ncbi:unnamed protein product [Arabidopsis arenosa]|uniref:Uncharacterized protein n=1 Tax=Arabidopsis arenosa TaxID=38785 RepID=A0A8S2ALY1_ARAAE|nr:unnamed protein product [Arabidopsis arenosa]